MSEKQNEFQFNFSFIKLLLPVFLGLGVIIWLFVNEFKHETIIPFHLGIREVFFLLLAFALMLVRDGGMIWRFRIMSGNQLSWRSAFNVHILSEFTSAITPSAIGGSSLVMLFLKKEGILLGKGVTITMINLFFDELIFVIFCPIILLFVPFSEIFNSSSVLTSTISTLFWSVYAGYVFWTAFLFIGLFVRPTMISSLISLIFKLKFLKKWEHKTDNFTSNLLTSSIEISKRKLKFWLEIFGLTILTWTARFMVVNMLFLAFMSKIDHLVVFGRQIILWMVIHLTPTPGGSGFYEYMFNNYFSDILPQAYQLLIIIAVWRILTYYNYLIAGTLIVFKWLKPKPKKN